MNLGNHPDKVFTRIKIKISQLKRNAASLAAVGLRMRTAPQYRDSPRGGTADTLGIVYSEAIAGAVVHS